VEERNFLQFLYLCTSKINKGDRVQGEGERRGLFPSTMEKEEAIAAHRKEPYEVN